MREIDLTDFDPRAHHLEPELQLPPPRPVPAAFGRGRYATARRRQAVILLVIAALCFSLSAWPLVERWGQFFLPLAYLDWIGFGLLAIAAAVALPVLLRRGPYRFFIHGTPSAARIVDLALVPTRVVNGQEAEFRYVAAISRHDAQGQLVLAETRSDPISPLRNELTACTYRVGDYVTALSLGAGAREKLRLYGFLGLVPGVGLVPKHRQKSLAAVLGSVLLGAAIFFILFWNVWAFSRYEPIAFELEQFLWPALAGAVLIGGGVLVAMFVNQRRVEARREARNRAALAAGEAIEAAPGKRGWFGNHGPILAATLLLGAPLLGAVIAICWALSANALLDRSPPVPTPAYLVEMSQTTHYLIFRTYTISYLLSGDDEPQDFLSDPRHMDLFDSPQAVATVRAGRFGWPWVEDLRPSDPSDPSDLR